MMLSRVAESLFWIGRYTERAENIARLIDAARRMSTLPRETGQPLSNEWSSILIAAGAREVFGEAIERADAGMAVDHLFFDETNPSSIRNCIVTARENARAIRSDLTQECWEALNSAWSEIRTFDPQTARGAKLADLIDWVKSQSALFRGAMMGTMVRDDRYHFMRMGAAVERTDSTARLLDVKYHVLLPSVQDVGSSADHYQWMSLLQAAAAARAYYFVTKSDVTARGVAEFLIKEDRFPRSLSFNAEKLAEAMGEIEEIYGQASLCREAVTAFRAHIEQPDIKDILNSGLHEFLTEVIERNYEVADRLAEAYGFAPITGDSHSNDGNEQ